MKKIVLILFMLAMCIFPMQAFAAEDMDTVPKINGAYLTNSAGETVFIEGTLVDTPTVLSDDEYCVTYEYVIPQSTLQYSDEIIDGSYSVRAYSTLYYKKTDSTIPPGFDQYLLTGVVGGWKIMDSSVSVVDADLTYGCSDTMNAVQQNTVKSNISSPFSYSTGFTKYAVDHGTSVVGATLDLVLQRGTYNWDLQLINNIISVD